MPFTSSPELLDWLSQNHFLNPQQVSELRVWTANEPDLHAFCKELLRRDWVTPYQVNQILKTGGETLVVGANRIAARIGEGAMGQVFKAWNVRLGRMVAVKMLHPDHSVSGKALDRFRREMQAAAALDHPNIVLIRDADEANGSPYLVMDYFDGIDLSRKMKAEGVQPIAVAVECIRQAAIGLQHASERGVVHRDLKPSNMLLVRTTDGSFVIKLLDFGLAKFERERDGQLPITQAGRLIGTVDFIAPEQAMDARTADVRADIYSLGCTLFYLLTGKAPFAGADQLEKLTARIQNEPPHVADYRPEVPPGLDAVIYRMMARNPADRFQSPLEAAAALAPFSGTAAPPVARPAFAPAVPVAAPIVTPVVPVASRPVADAFAPTPMVVASGTVETIEVDPTDDPGFLHSDFTSHAFSNEGFSANDGFTPSSGPSAVATTRAAATRAARAEHEEAESVSPSRTPMMLAMIGGLALLLSIGGAVAFFFLMGGSDVAPPVAPLGTMALELDSPPDRVWGWGNRKPILVKVRRQNFQGPVTLAIDAPPDSPFRCNPVNVAAGKDVGELVLIIGFQSNLGPNTVKITATSPLAHPATIDYPIEIVQVLIPGGGKLNPQPKVEPKQEPPAPKLEPAPE